MTDTIKRGLVFALFAAFISGFSIFYNKLIIVKGIDPQIFNILKNGGAAVVLFSYLLASKKIISLTKLSTSSFGKLLFIAFIGGSIPFILYFEGLKTTPALTANIIQKSMFLWVAIFAIPILKETINRWQLIGYFLVLGSNFVIGGFQGFAGNVGELLIFAATLFWSLENIIAKDVLKNVDATVGAWSRMFLGALIIGGFVAFQGKLGLLFSLTLSQILPIFVSIILLTLYVTTWYKALKLAPATAVTAILILATPITNILTMIFITHTLSGEQMIQAGVAFLGVICIALLSSRVIIPIPTRLGHT
ncbi:DMT family transporter [Candidatus Gottesmanbacteria bacterium]|nr:DMT family transporter [Candidatus Gottesmanbacteria bacterium]